MENFEITARVDEIGAVSDADGCGEFFEEAGLYQEDNSIIIRL